MYIESLDDVKCEGVGKKSLVVVLDVRRYVPRGGYYRSTDSYKLS